MSPLESAIHYRLIAAGDRCNLWTERGPMGTELGRAIDPARLPVYQAAVRAEGRMTSFSRLSLDRGAAAFGRIATDEGAGGRLFVFDGAAAKGAVPWT